MSKKAGVGTIKGVGEKTEKLFEKIGVYTCLLYTSPSPRD